MGRKRRPITRDDLFHPRYGIKTGKLDCLDGKVVRTAEDVFSSDEEEDLFRYYDELKARGIGPKKRAPPRVEDEDEDDNNNNFMLDESEDPSLTAPVRKRKTMYQRIIEGDDAPGDVAVATPASEVEACRKTLDFEGSEKEEKGEKVARREKGEEDDDDEEEGGEENEEKENDASQTKAMSKSRNEIQAEVSTGRGRRSNREVENLARSNASRRKSGDSGVESSRSSKLIVAKQTPVKEPAAAKRTTVKEPAAAKRTTVKEPAAAKRTTVKEPAAAKRTPAKEPATAKRTAVKEPAATKRTTVKEPAAAKRTTVKEPAAAKRTPAKGPAAAKWTPTKGPAAAKRTPTKGPAAAKRTPAKGPSAAKRTPAKRPSAAKRTPAKVPSAARSVDNEKSLHDPSLIRGEETANPRSLRLTASLRRSSARSSSPIKATKDKSIQRKVSARSMEVFTKASTRSLLAAAKNKESEMTDSRQDKSRSKDERYRHYDIENIGADDEEGTTSLRKNRSVKNKPEFLPSNVLRPLKTIGPNGVGQPLVSSTPMTKANRAQVFSRKPAKGEPKKKLHSGMTSEDILSMAASREVEESLVSDIDLGEDAFTFSKKLKAKKRRASDEESVGRRTESVRASRDDLASDGKDESAKRDAGRKGASERIEQRNPDVDDDFVQTAMEEVEDETRGSSRRKEGSDVQDEGSDVGLDNGVDPSSPQKKSGKRSDRRNNNNNNNNNTATNEESRRQTNADVEPSGSRTNRAKGGSAPPAEMFVPPKVKRAPKKRAAAAAPPIESSEDSDGPRRSKRNRTENFVAGNVGIYKWERGFRVKIGEQNLFDDKFKHRFEQGPRKKEKGRKATSKKKKKKKNAKNLEASETGSTTFSTREGEDPLEYDPDPEWVEVVDGDEIVKRRLFRPVASYEYISVNRGESNMKFQKCFESSSLAAGTFVIDVGGAKEVQRSRKSDMIFFCVMGEVEARIHETTMRLHKGDSFFVPSENVYSIKNLSPKDQATLVFFLSNRMSVD